MRTLVETGEGPGDLTLFDLKSGKEFVAVRQEKPIRSVAFSPAGRLLASGSPGGQAAKVWDVAGGKLVRVLPTVSVRYLAFAPDGKALATAHGIGGPHGNGSIQLWDTATWQEKAHLRGHTDLTIDLSFTPDSRSVFTASSDGRRGPAQGQVLARRRPTEGSRTEGRSNPR